MFTRTKQQNAIYLQCTKERVRVLSMLQKHRCYANTTVYCDTWQILHEGAISFLATQATFPIWNNVKYFILRNSFCHLTDYPIQSLLKCNFFPLYIKHRRTGFLHTLKSTLHDTLMCNTSVSLMMTKKDRNM